MTLKTILAQPLDLLAGILLIVSLLSSVLIIELLRGNKIIAGTNRADKRYLVSIFLILLVIFPIQLGGLIMGRRHAFPKTPSEAEIRLEKLKKAAQTAASVYDQKKRE